MTRTRTPVGAQRERIVILQRVATKDSHGGNATAYSTLDTVPAEVIALRAGERLQVEGIQSQVDLKFRIRSRTDVLPEMRVLWRPSWSTLSTPKTLEIHGVLPVEDGRMWMVLECGEVQA
jgi:SPP1 family predicted phage head-tail adaptor